ncbi:ABC transporter ATP-binding protein [Plantactinospora sp. KBS50]|uniref:ABC transporter ATP-binding protein n=1 Tax=Plantactinospora sp. KBS50 TaxID=2024580 RepID=UPI000BAAD201|nr:ABC transporter ATP-binding protein [Plantactinospora sp. KBS50]ASW57955.1 methionine ABC transporter ATP-binding protein [Plantactinospora sp. KBS50]
MTDGRVAPQTAATPRPAQPPLLAVQDLWVEFGTGPGRVPAVRGISLEMAAGDSLALVGESGSGKSATARTIIGILRPPGRVTRGSIRFQDRDLLALPESQRRAVRGSGIAMIFQEALAALNPVLTVGFQIGELFRKHQGCSRAEARRRTLEVMSLVQIPHAHRRLGDYPHQFSGGMRQRVVIAMALALRPQLVIADEPTTALDVTIQAQIMELLQHLLEQEGLSLLLITHDLGVAAAATRKIAVMYAGRIVETGPLAEVYRAPAHPYTRGLMASIRGRNRADRRLYTIKGAPPDPRRLPPGCPFAPRCANATEICRESEPPLLSVSPGRASACHHATSVLVEGILGEDL